MIDQIKFELPRSKLHEFEENGVVKLSGVVNVEECKRLQKDVEELIADIGSTPTGYDLEMLGDTAFEDEVEADVGSAHQYNLDVMAAFLEFEGDRRLVDGEREPKVRGAYYIDTGCWTRAEGVREIALTSRLPEIAAQLLQSNVIRFFDDQMFVKEPGTRQRTAFHQDYPFFNVEGDQGLVVWIPLDPVDANNGRLSYVKGSHRWQKSFAASMFITHTPMPGSQGERVPDIEARPSDFELLSFDVVPGDVIIHHFKTLHGAGGNLSCNRRRAMSLRYVGSDMRYKFRPGAPMQPHHSYHLNDGDDLECADFPTVLNLKEQRQVA